MNPKILMACLGDGKLFKLHRADETYDDLVDQETGALRALLTLNGTSTDIDISWVTVVDLAQLSDQAPESGDDVTLVDGKLVFLGELRGARARGVRTVDEQAAGAIAQGFEFEDRVFSLSIAAQMSLNGVWAVRDQVGTFPLAWPTKDDTKIVFLKDQAEFEAFYKTAFAAIRAARTTAAQKKAAIQSADSKAAVAAEIAQ